MTKKCSKCHRIKRTSQFWERTDRLGFFAWCIKCCKEEGRFKNWPSEEYYKELSDTFKVGLGLV